MSIEIEPNSAQTSPVEEEVKIDLFQAIPYPDGRRVKVNLKLSPFHNYPNAVINLKNQENQTLASVNILNIFEQDNEITLHFPGTKKVPGTYSIEIDLFYIEEEEFEEEGELRLKLNQSPIGKASTSISIQ